MNGFPGRLTVVIAALCLIAQTAAAITVSWDREENTKQAGRALAEMWAKKGALGIFEHIEGCHEEDILQATEYTREAETCLVQDVVHSQVSASMYAGLSDQAREMSGSPTAEAVLIAMKIRLGKTAKKFGFTPEEMGEIVKLGVETAAPAYFQALKEQMAAAQ